MSTTNMLWVAFGTLIAAMFILDVGVLNRRPHEPSFKESLTWTLVWVALALFFTGGILVTLGTTKAMEFLAGYLIEESLSVDNLFVFIMIFSYFHVPKRHQPKILTWGIIGALVMRGIFIVGGIALFERFHWILYLFGVILIVTGIKMAFGSDEEIHPERNLLLRLVRKILPITKRIRDDRFFIRKKGVVAATPLFLTLVVIESSDLIFAIDSIPAVLAVSRDPFIVYTSNVFAIMGLRSLYHLLSRVMGMFVYLKLGVSIILAYVGIKMLLSDTPWAIPLNASLGVILGVLTVSIATSIMWGGKKGKSPHGPGG